MRFTRSYKMKLTGDLRVLEMSLDLYRETLRILIPIVNNNWETLSEYKNVVLVTIKRFGVKWLDSVRMLQIKLQELFLILESCMV